MNTITINVLYPASIWVGVIALMVGWQTPGLWEKMVVFVMALSTMLLAAAIGIVLRQRHRLKSELTLAILLHCDERT